MCITPFYGFFHSARLHPCLNTYGYRMSFNSFHSLCGLVHPLFFFDILAGFKLYFKGQVFWGLPFYFSASITFWNVDTDLSMILSSLCNLAVLLLSSSITLLLSKVMSFSTNVHYTQEFKRLETSGNTTEKLSYNEVGSTGSWYSSTILPYPMTVQIHIKLPYFMVLWP